MPLHARTRRAHRYHLLPKSTSGAFPTPSPLPAAWGWGARPHTAGGLTVTERGFGFVLGTALYNRTDLSQQPDVDTMDGSIFRALHAHKPSLTDFPGWQPPQGKPLFARGQCVRKRHPLSTLMALERPSAPEPGGDTDGHTWFEGTDQWMQQRGAQARQKPNTGKKVCSVLCGCIRGHGPHCGIPRGHGKSLTNGHGG